MNIITKFTVATEEGLEILLRLTRELATEKFTPLLGRQELERYIAENFNAKTLVVDINSMSNQWLVVYADQQPAGYARITANGIKPKPLLGKRAMRIADFGVLQKYQEQNIRHSLLEKCLAVCSSYEGIWINEYPGNPVVGLFENKGFIRQPDACQLDELPLASVCLIKQ